MNKTEKGFEGKIKEGLRSEYKMNDIQKEKLWEKIESTLEFVPLKKKRPWKGVVSAVAACAIFGFGLTTDPGLALMDNVKQMFVPEKDVTLTIEGMEEDGKVALQESKTSDYVIYIDEERYKMVKEDGESIITTKEPLPAKYPEVFMKITHKNTSVDDTVSALEKETETTFEQTDTPLQQAFKTKILEGQEWDSLIHRYYVISDHQGGSYVIHQQYFLEAAEGHGVRLNAMLEEFKIVE